MQEPHTARGQADFAEGAQTLTLTHRAPGTRLLDTYCIALLIGDRVELSAIVERGVNPTPLICRLPEWPETAGRMQGEQQQSREQRREEEKIKGENKKSRKQYSKNSCPTWRESTEPRASSQQRSPPNPQHIPALCQPRHGICARCCGGGTTSALVGTAF